MRREPLEHELSGQAILLTVLLFIGSWLAFGLQTWILARSVGGPDGAGSLTVAAVCGYALAATIGQLAVIAPAGVGVRDSLLVVLLGPSMGDVLLAGAGWAYARSHRLLSAHPSSLPSPEASDHRLG